jgi:hypothetical protein
MSSQELIAGQLPADESQHRVAGQDDQQHAGEKQAHAEEEAREGALAVQIGGRETQRDPGDQRHQRGHRQAVGVEGK